MYIETLCPPAVLFVMFMMLHIIIELFEEHYAMALLKLLCSVAIIVFIQLLCSAQMQVVAWILVFLPLIIYSYMTFLLFFVFGTNPTPSIKQFEIK